MATLVENVNRVVSALNDIKNAIIAKGITPTGKCETFADAISKISGSDNDFLNKIQDMASSFGISSSSPAGNIDILQNVVDEFKETEQAMMNNGIVPNQPYIGVRDLSYYIDNISVAKVGTFYLPPTNTTEYVQIGFRPKILVYSRCANSNCNPVNDITYIYDEDWGDYIWYHTTRTPTKLALYSSVFANIMGFDGAGVYLKTTTTGVYFKYYAIG